MLSPTMPLDEIDKYYLGCKIFLRINILIYVFEVFLAKTNLRDFISFFTPALYNDSVQVFRYTIMSVASFKILWSTDSIHKAFRLFIIMLQFQVFVANNFEVICFLILQLGRANTVFCLSSFLLQSDRGRVQHFDSFFYSNQSNRNIEKQPFYKNVRNLFFVRITIILENRAFFEKQNTKFKKNQWMILRQTP